MIRALEDDSKTPEQIDNDPLFAGYKTPADAISQISRQYNDAELDADRFGITDLKEAVRIAKEFGIEIDASYTQLEQREDKIMQSMLVRQKNFAMQNEKNGTPEKSQQIWDTKIAQQNEYQQELADTAKAEQQAADISTTENKDGQLALKIAQDKLDTEQQITARKTETKRACCYAWYFYKETC